MSEHNGSDPLMEVKDLYVPKYSITIKEDKLTSSLDFSFDIFSAIFCTRGNYQAYHCAYCPPVDVTVLTNKRLEPSAYKTLRNALTQLSLYRSLEMKFCKDADRIERCVHYEHIRLCGFPLTCTSEDAAAGNQLFKDESNEFYYFIVSATILMLEHHYLQNSESYPTEFTKNNELNVEFAASDYETILPELEFEQVSEFEPKYNVYFEAVEVCASINEHHVPDQPLVHMAEVRRSELVAEHHGVVAPKMDALTNLALSIVASNSDCLTKAKLLVSLPLTPSLIASRICNSANCICKSPMYSCLYDLDRLIVDVLMETRLVDKTKKRYKRKSRRGNLRYYKSKPPDAFTRINIHRHFPIT